MSLSLDHLVIHVADLERAIAGYTELGFTVQRGGSHADGRTHNALIGLADGSYLELIAFLQPPGDHRWARHAQAGRQGFIDYALLPHDAGEVIAATRSRGLDYAGPQDGGRVRPDGLRLQWQTGTPPTPELPFLCGDVTPRAGRVPEGQVRQHANGVSGVASITVAVEDLVASLVRHAALLGVEARPLALPGLGVQQAQLPLGTATLVLVAPLGESPGAQALRQVLAERGPGVIGIALRSACTALAIELPAHLTQSATIQLVPTFFGSPAQDDR